MKVTISGIMFFAAGTLFMVAAILEAVTNHPGVAVFNAFAAVANFAAAFFQR